MKLPIFRDDNGDLDAFETVESAQLEIEPFDAEHKSYELFDGEGRKLRAAVITDDRWHERVVLQPTEMFDIPGFRSALIYFVSNVDPTLEGLEEWPLARLVSKAAEYAVR